MSDARMSRIRLERDNRERRGSTALGTATLSGHIRLLPDKRNNAPKHQPGADKSGSGADSSTQFIHTRHLRHRGSGWYVDAGGSYLLLSSVHCAGAGA